MRCLIIDDEPAARNILKTYIADTEELQLAGESGMRWKLDPRLRKTRSTSYFWI